MAQSARWQGAHQHPGVRGMGRGPGVRAASATSCQIDFRFGGERCREKLAIPPTPANLRYAKRLKATIEHEIAIGTFDYARHFPHSPRAKRLARVRSSAYTWRELFGLWEERGERALQPETFADYQESVRHVWMPLLGAVPADQPIMGKVIDWISDQPTTRKRILNVLTPLRHTIRAALAERILSEDPLSGLKVQRPARLKAEDIDPFSPAEVAAVVAHLAEQTANLCQFWAWTGMREGELLALTWPDIDLERGVARVTKAVRGHRVKAPKTANGVRTVRLLQPAAEALRRQMVHTRLVGKTVFQNPLWRPQAGSRWHEPQPGPWTEKRLRMAWEAACAAAGVRYRPPRQLRHTFASWTLSAGESPIWVAKMMGHESPAITQRVYARFIPEVIPDAGARTVALITAGNKAR